jgi:iron complex transport system permease protein
VSAGGARTWSVPVGGGHLLRGEARAAVVAVALVLAAVAVGFAALCYGDGWSSPYDVLAALTGGGPVELVVTRWRLPRVVAALVFGVALGLAGAVFQNLTRNPLGTPDVIGLDQGAYTGVLLVLTAGGALASGLVGDGTVGIAAAALAGGLAAAAVVYLLAAGPGTDGNLSGLRLIVIGIAVNAVLTAVNTWLVLRADLDSAMAATAWSAGSLNGIDWHELVLPAAAIGCLTLLLAALARPMQQLALGDDVAATSGVGPRRLRLLLVVAGVGLTATVTAAAGPIVFVALAAPQIGRRLAGAAGVTLVPAALTGAVLLVAADLVAQAALAPIMLPVGVVTSALGGLYLLWLLSKEVR